MKTTAKPTGIIVPTALFVAMFVLLLSTVLIVSMSQNLGMSLNSLESTDFRYKSFAAANELLSDLNSGLKVGTYTKAKPRRVEAEGRTTESWVEKLDAKGKNVLVVARTYRGGQVGQAQVVKRLATFRENSLARVYTNAPDKQKNTADPIFYSDLSSSGAWSELPPVPRMRYKSDGTLEYKSGEVAGSLPYVSGSPDGSLYSIYVPTIDGWGDVLTPIFALPLRQGDLCLNTIINGAQQGKTVAELQPILQVLIDVTPVVTLSQGAVPLKFNHESGQWDTLPPVPDVKKVGGKFVTTPGDYRIKGVAGPPAAFDGGVTGALYRKGQDVIYQYTEESGKWNVITPPGQDIMLLAADEVGNTYVQTGKLMPVGVDYLLNILAGNLDSIYANTATSALRKYEHGKWSTMPDPPAQFYDKNGNVVDEPYPGNRGPTLGGMVGGQKGELVVVNRPRNSSLVDTVYRYKKGAWKMVPSPPNTHYDASGQEIKEDTLPSRLEVGTGSKGQTILRVPNANGPDSVFLETQIEGQYDLLPPVHANGSSPVKYLFQMSAGQKGDGSGRGHFIVRATYF